MQSARSNWRTGDVSGIVSDHLPDAETAVFVSDSDRTDRRSRRTGLSEPMPNGDPPSLILWGSEEE